MPLNLPPAGAGAPVPAVRGGIVSRRALFERLGRAARVTQVSAPAGSGKTFLLRSWIDAEALTERAAWVSVQDEERDPQRFWVSVLDALRQTAAGSSLVRPLTAAPDLDGWAFVERLLADLEPLEDQTWLLIDDAHELRSAEALRQLELLLMRGPQELRVVLATRHDLRLGLHRLRLTAVDRCDRCGAQAYVRVLLPSRLELLFCAHHELFGHLVDVRSQDGGDAQAGPAHDCRVGGVPS